MSNNGGTFVPTAAPVTVVGAPKPVLGHVVQATSSSMKFGGEHMHIPSVTDQPKERYKWHTVVDGISKFIFSTKYSNIPPLALLSFRNLVRKLFKFSLHKRKTIAETL